MVSIARLVAIADEGDRLGTEPLGLRDGGAMDGARLGCLRLGCVKLPAVLVGGTVLAGDGPVGAELSPELSGAKPPRGGAELVVGVEFPAVVPRGVVGCERKGFPEGSTAEP